MPAHSDLQPILDQFAQYNIPPVVQLSPENARNLPTLKNAVEDYVAQHAAARATTLVKPMPEPVGAIKHVLIPSGRGQVLARVYYPAGQKDSSAGLPVLVYYHGGGWVIANLDVYDPSCRALANAAECIVVSVAYRQAPEHTFPAAHDDAYAALQWVLQHAAQLGGNPACVAVGGESAGGNLAAAACWQARQQGGRQPLFQLLIYPIASFQPTPSYQENGQNPPLLAPMMPWFFQHYLPSEAAGHDPRIDLINAPGLAGLPPALVVTAELDVLRDEGELLAQRLQAAGVPTTQVRYPGMTHEFFGTAGLVGPAQDALQEAADSLKAAFQTVPEMA